MGERMREKRLTKKHKTDLRSVVHSSSEENPSANTVSLECVRLRKKQIRITQQNEDSDIGKGYDTSVSSQCYKSSSTVCTDSDQHNIKENLKHNEFRKTRSSQDGNQEDIDVITTSGWHKIQSGQYRDKNDCESKGRYNTSCEIEILKRPGWIELQGYLAKANRLKIYLDMYNYVQSINDAGESPFDILQKNLDAMERQMNDMIVIEIVYGCSAAFMITNDTNRALKLCKNIKSKLCSSKLQNSSLVNALVHYRLCMLYMSKNKAGKAYSAMEIVKARIYNHAPSIWTAQVCKMKGDMDDRLAQVRPAFRKKHQELALNEYSSSRDYCLYQPNEEDNYLCHIFRTVKMLYIILDMPTITTTRHFRDTDIVYKNLNTCSVTEAQFFQAEKILNTLTSQIRSISDKHWVFKKQEYLLIAELFLYVKKSKLCIQLKKLYEADSHLDTSIDKYYNWNALYKTTPRSELVSVPNISRDVKRMLNNLQSEIHLKIVIHKRHAMRTATYRKPASSSPSPSSEAENTEDELNKLGNMSVRNESIESDDIP